MKLEEPCEGRLSSTVPWERKGEIPLRDPIKLSKNLKSITKNLFSNHNEAYFLQKTR
jgi:hypothetical protein